MPVESKDKALPNTAPIKDPMNPIALIKKRYKKHQLFSMGVSLSGMAHNKEYSFIR